MHTPIEISVSLGNLQDELLNLDRYGVFHRGFDTQSSQLYDEPHVNLETVITLKLTVRSDLQPEWGLYSDRAAAEGSERSIPWAQRELIAPTKLDAGSDRHLAWGARSLLNKLSDDAIDISGTLAAVARQTRSVFDSQPIHEFNPVLARVKTIADQQGVQIGQLKALLDVNGVSLSNGAVSLHNFDNTPLRQLGTGSTRLLVSGIQREASNASIMLIDEVEYGLEPFRITKLLNNLGAKSEIPQNQVFITTHSPIVLRELQANQLWILRKSSITPTESTEVPPPPSHHSIYAASLIPGAQATIRSNAESFFANKILVCEGKTEIGLCRGLDLFNMETENPTWLEKGVAFADGGGDPSLFARATAFKDLGYDTAIFKDSDKSAETIAYQQQAAELGIPIFEWGYNYSTESAIFAWCPDHAIPNLLEAAIERKGLESVQGSIQSASGNTFTYSQCLSSFSCNMRAVLGDVARKKEWFKDIEPMENIARSTIGPSWKDFSTDFQQVLGSMCQWLES